MASLTEGLDVTWLEAAARRDPLTHAYALWDRVHEAPRTRFVSVQEGREVRGYLLIYQGAHTPRIVHWVGPSSVRELLDAFPPRPMMAVVPLDLVQDVAQLRGPIGWYEIEVRSLADRAPVPPEDPRARRLTGSDAPALAALLASETDRLLEGYPDVDLDQVPVFGAFFGERLVAVAKASVTLPRVWVLSGIVTAAAFRGRGFGRAVTTAALRAAVAAGARPGLYVRADNAPAVELYASLGFETVARRAWVDAGAERPP